MCSWSCSQDYNRDRDQEVFCKSQCLPHTSCYRRLSQRWLVRSHKHQSQWLKLTGRLIPGAPQTSCCASRHKLP